MPRYQRLQYRG